MPKFKRNHAAFPKGFDALSAGGAEAIKKEIHRYWRARGYAGVKAERYEIPGMLGTWGVRSNLVNGMPPRGSVRFEQLATVAG